MTDPMQIVVGSVDLSAVDTVEQIIKIIPMDASLDHRGNMTAKEIFLKIIKQFYQSKTFFILFFYRRKNESNFTLLEIFQQRLPKNDNIREIQTFGRRASCSNKHKTKLR